MQEERFENENMVGKWLKYLFITRLVQTFCPSLNGFGVLDLIGPYGQWIAGACAVYFLFQMEPACGRYRKAGIFLGVNLACTLIGSFLGGAALLASAVSLAAALCSYVACYQEYHAHAELVAESDPELSRKWERLFVWQILVSVLNLVITFLVTALVSGGAAELAAASAMVTVVIALVLQIIYLVYLYRMMKRY